MKGMLSRRSDLAAAGPMLVDRCDPPARRFRRVRAETLRRRQAPVAVPSIVPRCLRWLTQIKHRTDWRSPSERERCAASNAARAGRRSPNPRGAERRVDV
jgi:hypothetical protein